MLPPAAWVGEEGMELFTAGRSGGHITPNGGGGVNLSLTISAGVFQGSQADARKFADWVTPLIINNLSQYGSNPFSVGSRR